MEDNDFQLRIMNAISNEDHLWNKHKFEIAVQADSWFRQNGIIADSVINNTIAFLFGAVKGIKDVCIRVNAETKSIKFMLAVSWFTYYFRKKRTLVEWGPYLSANFPRYDIELSVHKFSDNWYTIRKDLDDDEKKEQKKRAENLRITNQQVIDKHFGRNAE